MGLGLTCVSLAKKSTIFWADRASLSSTNEMCLGAIEGYKNKDNSINIYFKFSYLTYVLIAIWSDITNALQKIFYHIGFKRGYISEGIFDIYSFS